MSQYEKVCNFNRAADQECPDKPKPMSPDQVHFLTKMMIDELSEFMVTLHPDYKLKMIKMITDSKDLEYKKIEGYELIAEQADALVDSNYYALNTAAKHGMNLDKVFDAVHDANMSKCDLKTGKFLRREDGKIIKPDGWKSPDIVQVVKDMSI